MAMEFSDETVMAYADGELDAPTRAASRGRPGPTATWRSAWRASTPCAYASRTLSTRCLTTRARASAGRRARRGRRRAPRRCSAAAARGPGALVVAAGGSAGGESGARRGARTPADARPPGGPLVAHEGAVQAGGALARALSEQLAGDTSAECPGADRGEFPFSRGRVLPQLRAAGQERARRRRVPRARRLAAPGARRRQPAPAGTGEYRAAATALPPGVASTLDALIAGEPLDARAEAAARARAWSR